VSVLSWVRVVVCLWLPRKAIKVAKWLLIHVGLECEEAR